MTDKFIETIKTAEKVLITSHISPDPDAVASVLLLGSTLQLNFPDKKVEMVLEEEPEDLDFLTNYNQLGFRPLVEATMEFEPNLFIMVDANGFERCSRKDGKELGTYIAKKKLKTATIDHHQPEGKDEVDFYFNSGSPASVQEIYELCFGKMKLKKPEDYAKTTMVGLYSDTGGFAYLNSNYKATFKLVTELIAGGANVEVIKDQLNQYTEDQLRVVGELAVNTTNDNDFTYSFISDEFAEKWQEYDKPTKALHTACKHFINNYIRNVEGRQWGFLVYPDPLEGKNFYSVSLRSVGEVKDVSLIARDLGGGGHKPAAGAKVQAENVQGAIDKVKAAIAKVG